jgi:tRNA (cmo5U34)-methyltransferase
MPKVGDDIAAEHGNWKFGGNVPKTFDEHVSKSVPLYHEGHDLICDLSDFFVHDNSVVYEIGCSTGTLLLKLADQNSCKEKVKYVGIDIEEAMVSTAQEKLASKDNMSNKEDVIFVTDDLVSIELEPSCFIVCYYTIQFINPSVRQQVINKIYESLSWGGALLLFEKVRGADARFQDILTALYTDYKLRKGYTPDDIVSKSRSLKGVLEPFSSKGNFELLARAGFTDINSVQRYICFEGILAIK